MNENQSEVSGLTDDLEQIYEEITTARTSQPGTIPISFFDRRNQKILRIVNPGTESTAVLNLGKESVEFTLLQPVYLKALVFKSKDNERIPKLKVEFSNSLAGRNSQTAIVNADSSAGVLRATVGAMVTSFKITAEASLFRAAREQLCSLIAIGYSSESLLAMEGTLNYAADKLDALKEEAEKIKAKCNEDENKANEAKTEHEKTVAADKVAIEKQRTDAASAVEKLRADAQTIETTINGLRVTAQEMENNNAVTAEKLKEINTSLASAAESLTAKRHTLQTVEDLIQQKSGERTSLNEELLKLREEYRQVATNRNLFTDDIDGVAKQGNRQIWLYGAVMAAFIVLLSVVTFFMVQSTYKIIVLTNTDVNFDLWRALVSRAPLAILLLAIIEGSLMAIRYSFHNIARIHEERREIQKLCLIAKEATQNSLDGLDLDDQEALDYRVALRMELLKQYLKSDREAFVWMGFKERVEKYISRARKGSQQTTMAQELLTKKPAVEKKEPAAAPVH